MPCEPPGLAALDRDDVCVGVSAVFRAEGDPLAVGRELGVLRLTLEAGEPARITSVPARDPDVTRVSECDLACADGGLAEQAGALRGRRRAKAENTRGESGFETHWNSLKGEWYDVL